MEFKSEYDISEEEIYELAVEEAKFIGKTFSKEEIESLDEHLFDPVSEKYCIYGLMTGSCNSEKSNNFIKNLPVGILCGKDIKYFNEKIRSHFYMTPLEYFIYEDEEDDEEVEDENGFLFSKNNMKGLEMMKIIKDNANN